MTEPDQSTLLLRHVDHPDVQSAYQVVWKGMDVGSITLQSGDNQRPWRWSLDTVVGLSFPTRGDALSREEAMAQLSESWDRFMASHDGLRDLVELKASIAARMSKANTA